MFTGIIEEIGTIASLQRANQSGKLVVAAVNIHKDTKIGDSIAVNGICLTVVNIRKNQLEFDLSTETLRKSTFNDLKVGDKVNLERALLATARIGGHMVSGHVDEVGEIRRKIPRDKGFEFFISVPSRLLPYLAPKGSITIDGISLTIADFRQSMLVISVIPHTAKITTLGQRKIGDRVNIEVDLLSKYIERHLKTEASHDITEDLIPRVGYLPMGWIEN
ncbi:MAG: riboflavin synthase [bacterium]